MENNPRNVKVKRTSPPPRDKKPAVSTSRKQKVKNKLEEIARKVVGKSISEENKETNEQGREENSHGESKVTET